MRTHALIKNSPQSRKKWWVQVAPDPTIPARPREIKIKWSNGRPATTTIVPYDDQRLRLQVQKQQEDNQPSLRWESVQIHTTALAQKKAKRQETMCPPKGRHVGCTHSRLSHPWTISRESESSCRLETWSWRNRSATVAEISGKDLFILNRPVRFVLFIPGNAVAVTGVPTSWMLSDGSKWYRNGGWANGCNHS